ncbi:MAG TPA: TetR/AcrR family transcriptional regulator [Chitinivibrionales bacterium]|nr:TetR/AcrR family transcriptional regulator [Chitinivibrionales bacterium]
MDPRPREVRDQLVHDAKVNLILDAALKVFAEKGYHESRLEDIAATAGFSKASLYNYLEDKEEIFLLILIRLHEKIVDVLKKEIKPDRHLKDNLREMLIAILKIYSENFSFSMSMTDLKTMAPNSMQRFQERHQQLTARFKHYSKEMLDLSAAVFAAGRKRGEIASLLDDKTLSQFVSSIVRGVMFECKSSGKVGEVTAHADKIMDFLTNGLGFTNVPARG